MTDNEKMALNREIAMLIEPAPCWTDDLRDGNEALSNERCWWIELPRLHGHEDHERHPVEFTSNWYYAGMLLEMLPLVSLSRAGDFREGRVPMHDAFTCSSMLGTYVVDDDLKIAIACAFRDWKNGVNKIRVYP